MTTLDRTRLTGRLHSLFFASSRLALARRNGAAGDPAPSSGRAAGCSRSRCSS